MAQQNMGARFPRPKGPLLWFLMGLLGLWILTAISKNWAGVQAINSVIEAMAGSSQAVLHGQLWRLLTAALVHAPKQPMHVLLALMLLWFFATPLDEAWGSQRLFLFLGGSTIIAFLLQALVSAVAPTITPDVWYGSMVMADAAAVAWAFSNRSSTVLLFFVLPIRPLVMVGLLAVWQVFTVIGNNPGTEGLIAPFGAMLAGWMLCDSSPLRRMYLKAKLRRLERQAGITKKRKRGNGPKLRLIPGGREDDDDIVLH